jgi:hypothetical protein
MGRAARHRVGHKAGLPVYAVKLGSIISELVRDDVRQST